MGKPMFWVLLFLLISPCCCSSWECPPHELTALNHFKQELLDPYNVLASWRGLYCCSWKGITCHRLTAHVRTREFSPGLFVRCCRTMKSFTGKGGALPLVSLNHISLVCRSVQDSLDFYENVLGFVPIKRPGSFNFDGAWLFSYGIGIHLLQSPEPEKMPTKTEINPMDNHISFQCADMQEVEKRLEEMNIKLVKRTVEEMGIFVDQLFFHDPDGFMIEVCNCDNLPVVPLAPTSSCSLRPAATALQQQRSILCSAKADTAPLSAQMLRVP